MDEAKWLDEMFEQRIDLLLQERLVSGKDDGGKQEQTLEQAEAVLRKLSKEDWDTMDRFQDMVMEQSSKDSSYLYVCGFQDGIRIMTMIDKL